MASAWKDDRGADFRVHGNGAARTYDLYITSNAENGPYVGHVAYGALDEGCAPDAASRLTRDQAQALMDSLWDAGLRPAGAAGSAGQAAAMQEHIKDLRRVIELMGTTALVIPATTCGP